MSHASDIASAEVQLLECELMLEEMDTVVLVGFVVWLVDTLVPMAPQFRTVFRAVVGLGLALWLLSAFHVLPAGMWQLR